MSRASRDFAHCFLKKPLSAREAAHRHEYFRDQLGCLHCAYEQGLFSDVLALLDQQDFAASRTADLVLAVTLKRNGVKTFYTRNVKGLADEYEAKHAIIYGRFRMKRVTKVVEKFVLCRDYSKGFVREDFATPLLW
jgi:hypothetical protein